MNSPKSPPITTSEHERADRHVENADSFDTALDATLPSSDPSSSTATSIPAADAASPSPDGEALTETPLVDIALESVRHRTESQASERPDEELAAIRAEVNRLRESVGEIRSASVRVVRAKSDDVLEEARARIAAHPMATLVLGVLAGYLFGARR